MHGKPVTPKINKVKFDEAAEDLITEYKVNGRRSLAVLQRRIDKHLRPFFTGRRMADITTSDVHAYIAKRQATSITGPDGKTIEQHSASNAEINREIATLKRAFTLAIQAGKLLTRPHIPMLREDNVRTGFFEPEQLRSVMAHLPEAIQPVIEFAAITGWRTSSEVLNLQWHNVDFDAGEVRLDPGTTKNSEGRVFPMTDALRTLLETRQAERDALKKRGLISPLVFWRMVERPQVTKNDDGHRGKPMPKQITSFTKVWKSACKAAGCPGRIPHDLRRTAIRQLVRAGIPERVAMQMCGHKTRKVFENYNIVSEGDLKDAATKLNASATAATAAAAARQRG